MGCGLNQPLRKGTDLPVASGLAQDSIKKSLKPNKNQPYYSHSSAWMSSLPSLSPSSLTMLLQLRSLPQSVWKVWIPHAPTAGTHLVGPNFMAVGITNGGKGDVSQELKYISVCRKCSHMCPT